MEVIKRAKLGSIEFSVVKSENITHDADVTEKPVEQGQDISDHMKLKPLTIALTGIVVGEDAASKLQQLYKYQKDGELLTYIGRSANNNMVIEKLSTDHGADIKNGFKFNMTMKQIRVATGKEVAITVNPTTKKADPKTKTQTKKKTNKGKQQPRKKNVSKEAKDKAKKAVRR